MSSTEVIQQQLTLGQARFLRTDDGSAAMNINGLAVGSPVVVWNGTGVGDTGGDWTHEAQGTETAGSMHAGTNGLDTGVRTQGQETRFDNGSNIDIDGTYDTVSFWMQPKAYPVGSNLRVRWRTSGGGTPGSLLNVSDYVDDFDLDVWQKVTIPIADFGLTADVAKLVFVYASKGGQHFYFDDIELAAAAGGGPFTFQVAAPAGENWHVTMVALMIAGDAADWNSDTFASLVGSLTNGLLIRHRRLSDAEVIFSINSKDNVDLFGRYHPQETVAFADDVLLVGLMLKPGNASVVITDDEVLEYVVRDDLSGIDSMRAFVHYGVEVVT